MTEAWTKPNFIELTKKLGSESFLEPKSLLVLVLPLALITSLFTTTQGEVYGYPVWLIANLASLSLVALLVLFTRFIWLRFAPDLVFARLTVLAISGLFGFIKSYSTLAFLDLLIVGQIDIALDNPNLLGGIIAGAIAIPTASMAMVLINQFNSEREILVTAESIKRLGLANSGEIGRLRNLAETIRGVAITLANSASPLIPAMEMGVIKSLVDKHLRPLANELYRDASKQFQSFRFTELLKTAISNKPAAIPMSLIYIAVLPTHINLFGLVQGAVYNLASALASYLVIRFGWKILVAINIPRQVAYFVVTVVMPATLGYFAPLLTSVETVGNEVSVIASVAWLTQNAIVIGIAYTAFQAAQVNHQKLQLVFNDQSDSTIALLAKKRRSFANQIHGEVQSRLMSVVLRNEAGDGLDKEFAINELNAVADLIDSGPKQFISLEKSIQSLKQNWSGFVEIDYEIDFGLIQENNQQLVYSIIEEGISNALRHGLADRVEIQLIDHQLLIKDNGMGPKKGTPGIGSQLLHSFSADWELTALEDGGSCLRVSVPT